MNYFDLIINGFTKDPKVKYPNYYLGRKYLEEMLLDKDARISSKEAAKIVKAAKDDSYLRWRATNYIFSVITDSKKINKEAAISIVQEFLIDDKEYKNFCKERISEWLCIKGGGLKQQHVLNIFKFDIFKDLTELVDYLAVRSSRSIKSFGSLANLYPHFLQEKEVMLVRNRVKKIINKLTVNDKNASLILKALSNKDIAEWVGQDEEMKRNLMKFLPSFFTRDVFSEKMLLGKNIFNMYKDDTKSFKKVQEIFVELVCNSYSRYENKIMQILSVQGTSPREAFATIVRLGKKADFLCRSFPELEKLKVLI